MKTKFDFLEGFIFGIIILTLFIISQYGLNFFFIVNSNNILSSIFHDCFRAITMLTIGINFLIIYHYCTNKNFIETLIYTIIYWSYYDIIFLFGNFNYINGWLVRDFIFIDISIIILFVVYNNRLKNNISSYINLKKLFIWFIIFIPIEFLLLYNYVNVSTNWYLDQYKNIEWLLRDIIFKLIPSIIFYLSRRKIKC